ncbi:IS3 family transposase [Thermosipho globiformans]|nr:IS3 family transposase [Thermosipho globiformans]
MVKINKEKTKEEYKKLIEEYIKFCNEERYQVRLKEHGSGGILEPCCLKSKLLTFLFVHNC